VEVIVSEPKFGNHLADMLLADGATTAPSVVGDLMRQRFEGDRSIRQVESRWVPGSGPFGDGHWEEIEVIDVGPAPA
jgi:hypothetical protein